MKLFLLLLVVLLLAGCDNGRVPPPDYEVSAALESAEELIADRSAVTTDWYRNALQPSTYPGSVKKEVSRKTAERLRGKSYALIEWPDYHYYVPEPKIDAKFHYYAYIILILLIIFVYFVRLFFSEKHNEEESIALICITIAMAFSPLILAVAIYVAVPLLWGGQHFIWWSYSLFLACVTGIFLILLDVLWVAIKPVVAFGKRGVADVQHARKKALITKKTNKRTDIENINLIIRLANELDGNEDDQQTMDDMNDALTELIHSNSLKLFKFDFIIIKEQLDGKGYQDSIIRKRVDNCIS